MTLKTSNPQNASRFTEPTDTIFLSNIYLSRNDKTTSNFEMCFTFIKSWKKKTNDLHANKNGIYTMLLTRKAPKTHEQLLLPAGSMTT